MHEEDWKDRVAELEDKIEELEQALTIASIQHGKVETRLDEVCKANEAFDKENQALSAIVNQYEYGVECRDERRLWELYLQVFWVEETPKNGMTRAQEALKAWKEREK